VIQATENVRQTVRGKSPDTKIVYCVVTHAFIKKNGSRYVLDLNKKGEEITHNAQYGYYRAISNC